MTHWNHPLGSDLLLAVPFPGWVGCVPNEVGMSWPQQWAPSIILPWSLSALFPSYLVDWVPLTRVLLAQKSQQLGMENPALKELLGSAAAGVQCPSSSSPQPSPGTWEIVDWLYLFWRGLWHGAVFLVWCKWLHLSVRRNEHSWEAG